MQGAKIPPDVIREAIKLQAQGWTQGRIAEHFGIHPDSLSRRLARFNKRALERIANERGAERMAQYRQLKHVADEAMQGWERSKLPAETVKTVRISGEPDPANPGATTPSLIRTEKTTKSQVGDPWFLSEARQAMADIRKVLKIDDGTKKIDMNLGGSDGGPIQISARVLEKAEAKLSQWRQQMRHRLEMSLADAPRNGEPSSLREVCGVPPGGVLSEGGAGTAQGIVDAGPGIHTAEAPGVVPASCWPS